MRVLLSRLVRERHPDPWMPITCHAWTSVRALREEWGVCDCVTFCKYGPRGNAPALAAAGAPFARDERDEEEEAVAAAGACELQAGAHVRTRDS